MFMNNPTLKELFGSLQNTMIAEAKMSDVIAHPTDKGDNTEANWLTWFNEYLPKRYRASKATIIDFEGNKSDQIDIVLYDAQYSYLALKQNNVLYLPAESVYAVFEVKQNISKEHLEYAGAKAESVRSLHRTSAPIPYVGGVYPPKEPHRIIAGILTTSNTWKDSFGEPFKRCVKDFNEQQQIDCGCILQAGAFYYNYNTRSLITSTSEESLVFFFLQLLMMLQNIGTVPAIDLNAYMKVLKIEEESL